MAQPDEEDDIVFYTMTGTWTAEQAAALARLEARSSNLYCEYWRPSTKALRPPGSPHRAYYVYSIAGSLGLFRGTHFGAVTLRDGAGNLRHCSMTVPRYARFPFMKADDVQIGATWTDDAWQGQGLATRSLLEAAKRFSNGRRVLWYLCETGNLASQKVAERAGFHRVGVGRRKCRLGLRLLGYYAINNSEGLGG